MSVCTLILSFAMVGRVGRWITFLMMGGIPNGKGQKKFFGGGESDSAM